MNKLTLQSALPYKAFFEGIGILAQLVVVTLLGLLRKAKKLKK